MTLKRIVGVLLLVAAGLSAIAGLDDLSINRNNWATLFDLAAILGAIVLALIGVVLLALPRTGRSLTRAKNLHANESPGLAASLGGTFIGGASVYAALDALFKGAIRGGRHVGQLTYQAHHFAFFLRVAFLLVIGALLLWLFLPGAIRIFRPRDDE